MKTPESVSDTVKRSLPLARISRPGYVLCETEMTGKPATDYLVLASRVDLHVGLRIDQRSRNDLVRMIDSL